MPNDKRQPKDENQLSLQEAMIQGTLNQTEQPAAIKVGKSAESMKKLQDALQKLLLEANQQKMKKAEQKAKLSGSLNKSEYPPPSQYRTHSPKGNSPIVQEQPLLSELPIDYRNPFIGDRRFSTLHTASPEQGLPLSITHLGKVDLEFISHICNLSLQEIITALQNCGAVYQNPETWQNCFYLGFETADTYLSGHLGFKLQAAETAESQYPGHFARNITALQAVMPATIPAEQIYVTLGSPWLPTHVIDEYINFLFGKRRFQLLYEAWIEAETQFEPISGTWTIPNKIAYSTGVRYTETYGTAKINALNILEKTLNGKDIRIYDRPMSGTRRLNSVETLLAKEKQRLLVEKFQDWIFKEKPRKEYLQNIYHHLYGCYRSAVYSDDFLLFAGMDASIHLYAHQKSAVARVVFASNTLLAHDVGAGKTYIMVAAAMELRRMGISQKNLFVVPNNIVGQWQAIFLQMYPQSRLLIVEPKTFTPTKRQQILTRICSEDFDGILMAYSCFDAIPLSPAYQMEQIRNEMKTMAASVDDPRTSAKAALNRRYEKLQSRLEKLKDRQTNAESRLYFDDFAINTLFLDEAHNYKNAAIDTKTEQILGIHKSGSVKCDEMMQKAQYIQNRNQGRGVVLATGTPITNSVTDLFIVQSYLQGAELKRLHLAHFDQWAAMFGEKTSAFEIDVDTANYRMATRFSHFHNLPELASLLACSADFHHIDSTDGIPAFDGYQDIVSPKTPALDHYLQEISQRADCIRQGTVQRSEDNMLLITTDGRKAALDLRLIQPEIDLQPESKAALCAEKVFAIWQAGKTDHTTQLIFCDTSTPKPTFNLYEELKILLFDRGVPSEEIAFIHHYESIAARERLFAQFNSGKIRILIGSTFKLGIGVNVQEKLIAVHHLDIPWRPSDMVQREGRILRQGNRNEKIEIYRYITEASFDAYSWQLLESKQRFICQLLANDLGQRSGSDVDDTVLSYAEVKALAIGNPKIKKRVETNNELLRLQTLQRKLHSTKANIKQALANLPVQLQGIDRDLERSTADALRYEMHKKEQPENRRAAGAALLEALVGYADRKQEREFLSYAGFMIILPAEMPLEKPYVWLQGTDRYYVETGHTALGCLQRLDHTLRNLKMRLLQLQERRADLAKRLDELQIELKKPDPYPTQIAVIQKQLNQLDRELAL